MRIAGFDIGTTTVCGVLIDLKSGRTVKTQTRKNDSWIHGRSYERLQDPVRILELVEAIYHDFLQEGEITAIGLTGQMHGIVYVDADGNAVSPLYTWEDERGNCFLEEKANDGDAVLRRMTYAEELSERTGYPMATGFGLTTHYYNLKNHLVPGQAVTFCTIHSYVAMRLAGEKQPLVTSSDAASLGCFDVEKLCFDREAIARAGIDPAMLPECTPDFALVGNTREQAAVAAAIGDNQASVVGSLRNLEQSVLLNVGTSSQISMCLSLPQKEVRKELQQKLQEAGIELRPIAGDLFLMVGAGLCGGRAYALLEQFFSKTVEWMTGKKPEVSLYEKMNDLLAGRGLEEGTLKVDTRFCGTRTMPQKRGSISGIGEENFTPEEVVFGVLRGIAEELYGFYEEMREAGAEKPEYLIGSGNAIRSNPYLQKIFEKLFDGKLQIPQHCEEAAYGAAMAAMTVSGCVASLGEAQQMIGYEKEA